MGTITIDGRTFSGRNIKIINNRVIVDGVDQVGELHGIVEVRVVEGSIESLHVDAPTAVAGDVQGNVQCNGPLTVQGDVGGSVSGSVITVEGKVGGSVTGSVVSTR